MTAPANASRTSQLGRRLYLKPYGDELLTRGGDFWIFSARLIVLTMALAEAIAWGYMGSLMSRENPYIAAAIAGVFVFTLIWIIDATFMTLDFSRAFYERALTGKKEESDGKDKLKLAAGIAARVGIVTASLVITAPFLAQAIFAGDVRDELVRQNANAVASRRAQVEAPLAARVDELRAEQKELERQRVDEAAGVGLSGRYGRGPALETIEQQLAEKVKEIEAAEAERAAALRQFDGLSRQALEEQHGVQFLSPGIRSNAALLDEMTQDPQFRSAEAAVQTFLGFLFAGLLILKIFQPRSIAVYFNEQLHSIYDEYRKGIFDSYLPEAERAGSGGAIDPLRFEDWCVQSYAVIRREDERRRQTARECRMHELLVEQWQRLESDARRELEPLMQRYDETLTRIRELEAELHGARTASASATADLQGVETAYRSMQQHIERAGLEGPAFERAVAAANELDTRRRALLTSISSSEGTVAACSSRLEQRRMEATALQNEIATKNLVITDAQKRIGGERMKLAEVIGSQRETWSAQTA